jgi:eukaryotic-like serine/threonine-protein kinase
MSDVWAARDLDSGKCVALKLVTRGGVTAQSIRRYFRNEVRFLIRLRHPCVLDFYDCGQLDAPIVTRSGVQYAERTPYLVVEHVQGKSLRSCCGAMPWPQLRSILFQLLGALAHIHMHSIIHKDIKPDNLLLDERTGRVRLCDFGIAQTMTQLDNDSRCISAGSLRYMPPEQLKGDWRAVGPWTDLYSVGTLAYALATGAPPFRGTYHEIAQGHLRREPPVMHAVEPVPEGFEPWVRKLLRKRTECRPASAAEAARDLACLPGHIESRVLGSSPSAPRTDGWQMGEQPQRTPNAQKGVAGAEDNPFPIL